MATIISGNTPSTIGNDTTINGDITADNITPGGQIVGYQQGLWVPSFGNANGEVPSTPESYTMQVGWWTRVGNLITAQFCINLSNKGSLDNAQGIHMKGLPYKAQELIENGSSTTTQQSLVGFSYWTGVTDPVPNLTGYVIADESKLSFYRVTSAGAFNSLKFTHVTPSFNIRGQATYMTDDTTWTPINGATLS